MKVDPDSLIDFHDSLRDEWLPPLRKSSSELWGYIDGDNVFGNTDEPTGMAKELSSTWLKTLGWRHNEIRQTCIPELEDLYSAVHSIGLEYKVVDKDAADDIYQHG